MRHRAFDLSALTVADRPTALRAQMAAWAPLPDAEYLIAWQGAVAQVFAVDKSALETASVRNPQWLPETLARVPIAAGVRLVQALDGYEAQAWTDGVLRATRWWATRPSAEAWTQFLRQAGWSDEPSQTETEPQQPAWKKPAALPMPPGKLEQAGQGQESRLVGLLFLVLLGLGAASARDLWDSDQARSQARQDLVQMKLDVAPVLAAREKALAAADKGAALMARLQGPLPLEVLEELLRLLPPAGLIREFELQGQEVRVLVDLPADVPRSKVITDLESGGWFVGVAEVRDGQPRAGVDLQMKLASAVPPQRGNADAGLQRLNSEGLAPAARPAAPMGGKP